MWSYTSSPQTAKLTLGQIHAELRAGFNSGKLKSIEYRKYQLLQLAYLVQENADRIEKALQSDLGRPTIESRLCVCPFPSFDPLFV